MWGLCEGLRAVCASPEQRPRSRGLGQLGSGWPWKGLDFETGAPASISFFVSSCRVPVDVSLSVPGMVASLIL